MRHAETVATLRGLVLATPLLALVAGCPTDGKDPEDTCVPDTGTSLDPACTCDSASAEVGGGSDSFEPVEEGANATMVHGPQGGWHVLGSVFTDNMGKTVTIHYWIEVPSLGATVSDNTYRVVTCSRADCVLDADSADTCEGYYPGMFGYLDVRALADGDADTPPEILAGRELILHMDVTDGDGRTASDTLTVIATPDPVDVDTDTGTSTTDTGDTGTDTGTRGTDTGTSGTDSGAGDTATSGG